MKKTTLKKVLAFVIVAVMALPVMPAVTVSADTTIDYITSPTAITGGQSAMYGENSWTDYTIEFSVSNFTQQADAQNLLVVFRNTAGNSTYQFIVTPGGWVGLQSSNGWSNLADGGNYSNMPNGSTPVNYKIEVAGNNIKAFINGAQIFSYNAAGANANLTAGRVGWNLNTGASVTLHSFKVTLPEAGGGGDPGEPGEGTVVIDDPGPFNLSNRSEEWFGLPTWKNYIIEADVSGLAPDNANPYQWWNFQFRFRNGANSKFYYTYINGAGVDLKDTITWDPTWASGTAGASPTNTAVHYKFILIDNVITAFADDVHMFTFTDDYTADSTEPWTGGATYSRSILANGQVGFGVEGALAKVENFKVTLLDGGDAGGDGETTTGAVPILSPKVPVAGVYPISAYNYYGVNHAGAGWQYNETIVWSTAVQTTFLPNTAYKATVTLTRRSGSSNMFGSRTINDVGGIYLSALPYAAVTTNNASTMVIEFNFPATGGTPAPFREFRDTLFYDDFSKPALDLNKWQDPGFYEYDRQGGSKWYADNVSIVNSNLRIRFAKETAGSNFISTGAVRTRTTFSNAYGYYEAKIKYPAVDNKRAGSWGAFWLMYYNSDNTGRTGAEIDIVEFAGVNANSLGGWASGGLHWRDYAAGGHPSTGFMSYNQTQNRPDGPNIYDGEFHIYALEWTPTYYQAYVDGIPAGRVTNTDLSAVRFGGQLLNAGICENPLYIKLSVESAGGTNLGWGGITPGGVWSDYMEVEYVVVYDRPKSANTIVHIEDYVTLDLDTAFNGAQAQVKATVKNINQFSSDSYSGAVSLDTPAGIISGPDSLSYTDLAYNQTEILYFDIDMDAYNSLTKAQETIAFNYTVDGIDPVGAAEIKFGYIEAARAAAGDIYKNSKDIDFSKGRASAAPFPAPSDLGATGKLAWDENYLYARIAVEDDIHIQTNGAGSRWQDDGVQISVHNGTGFREMEFTLLANQTAAQYCYQNSTGVTGSGMGTGAVNQAANTMQSAITREGTTTTYEIKIAWSYVGISNVTADSLNKIAVCINDNDVGGGMENRKYITYFEGITDAKGVGMGYLVLTETPPIPTYTIMATAGANGSIDPAGEVEVTAGEDRDFTITPDAGWYITDVLVDGASVGAVDSYTFENVDAGHTIEAVFARVTFTCAVKTLTAAVGVQQTIAYSYSGPESGRPVFSSSNAGICAVDGDGMLTPMKAGMAIVTVKCGAVTVTIVVTVK